MKRVILIRAARTDWDDQDRLVGDADLSINDAGRAESGRVAMELAGAAPKAIYCGSDSPAAETAQIIAAARGLKLRTVDDLREQDLGLWEGLTNEQFRERYPKVFKVWRETPGAVEPPDGEGLSSAKSRLCGAIRKILKRKIGTPVAIVVGRQAFACLKCRFLDGHNEKFWVYAKEPPQWWEFADAVLAKDAGD